MPKILIAEDEKSLNKAMMRFFNSIEDYEVFSCFDGKEAIDKVREIKPDLIVLDVIMPYKDGYEVADEIIQKGLDTKILFLTNLCSYFGREDLAKHPSVKVVCKAETSISEVREIISKLLK